jgi:hypothetical protein
MKRGAQYKKLVIIKLSLAGNNLIIPRQGEFGYSDIPAGSGKSITLFTVLVIKCA